MSEGSTGAAADEYRARSAQNWEEAAASWEAKREYTRKTFQPLTEWLREHAALAPGNAVLELAAGPGDTAIELAPSVVPGGRYLATDRASGMVAAAKARSRRRRPRRRDRVPGARRRAERPSQRELRRGRVPVRADADPRPGGSAVGDAAGAAPGGRCAFVVWGDEADNPWATRLWGVLDELVDLPATPPGAPGMFALADRTRLSSLVPEAGLNQTAWRRSTSSSGTVVRRVLGDAVGARGRARADTADAVAV